ncbi:MAG TPA: sodium:solute symporter family protein [Candidatus Eisenbacteria bacterium]|jgi:SSS family solute:Na+ symporter
MFTHSALDWALIAGYFLSLAWVWARSWGARPSTEDYLVAGRRVTLPAFVATLVATWYGGILGVGEYTWRYGVANWLVFGAPYYLGAALFALFLARRAREAELLTLPDLLERSYGRGAALVGAVAVFVNAAPAAYVLMLGTLFAAMFGGAAAPWVVAAAVLSVFYVDRGGLRTVIFTDQIQFSLMYGGFVLLLVHLVALHGGIGFLLPRVPASHWVWHGGNGAAAVIVWYVIALGTMVDPAFWQRAYAARDPRVARNGVLWSIAFWIIFDFMTTACGLYARALLPGLADPVYAFPRLANLTLPPVALGLFYLGMIATVMSTIDSYAFIAATTVGRDLVWRVRGGDPARIPGWSRFGLWLATSWATALALARPSVVALWHDLGSVVTPVLLLPVLLAMSGRRRPGPRGAMLLMLVPGAVALGWVLWKLAPAARGTYPWSIEPIYSGLFASLIAWAATRFIPEETMP